MSAQAEDRTESALRVLKAQAEARGMALADYLELLAEAGKLGPANGDVSLDEFDALLDEIANVFLPLPSLPPDFSRADVYADHD
jgi:hypothetical protein